MSTLTPNYNLIKPDSSDPFGNFRQSYNDNMDIIDANLGGGGGSGGHTIIDENGQSMTQRTGLEFTGNVQVTDDSVNDKTIVDILGGGGNVYGAFLDPSRVIYSAFTFDSSTHSWTATEDCILTDNMTPPDGSTAYFIRIDGKQVFAGYNTVEDPFVYVKKGQVVEYRAKSGSTMKAYGLTQGTNGIFAPVIYSDTERVIGVWRDNKPLYQKSWRFISTIPISANTWTSLGISGADIENLVARETLDDSGRSNSPVYCGVRNGDVSIYSTIGTDIQTVTLWYTKTTDVAGSGNWNTNGVPTHHYSTSEQVVGTWIDGKPLYETTFSFTIGSAHSTVYQTGIVSIDRIVNQQGQVDRGDGWFMNVNFARWDTSASDLIGAMMNKDGRANIFVNDSFYYGLTVYMTVQYTKTTDA